MESNVERLKEIIDLKNPKTIFIGGRPATGKSSLGFAVANGVASEGKAVALFNLETGAETIRKQNNIDERITIIDTPNISIEEIETKCKEIDNLKMVVIDYLQLVKSDTNICEKLQNLSNELNVTIIVLSQLSRTVEEKEEPTIADVKVDIIENFNTIAFLTRDKELIVVKNG